MQQQSELKAKVKFLANILGNTIRHTEGEETFELVENIRQLAKAARMGSEVEQRRLQSVLADLDENQLTPVCRAFSHFLNLANLAEMQHIAQGVNDGSLSDPVEALLQRLAEADADRDTLLKAIADLNIELVFTAHPTETNRRSLIHKLQQIAVELSNYDQASESRREKIHNRISELLEQIWYTKEIRTKRPTPVDEAVAGFTVIEQSLWHALPRFMRKFDAQLKEQLDIDLPMDSIPVSFASWMGGDRDGNPFVTATVTREVLLLSRWKAMDLYYSDIEALIQELSMYRASEDLLRATDDSDEPYRVILRPLRDRLRATRDWLKRALEEDIAMEDGLVWDKQDLLEPLERIYHSLCECGMHSIARGSVLDNLRRVHCFGMTLLRLDVRQHSERHDQVFSELTQYLGLGDYAEWSETERQQFLLQELQSRRPLLPADWQASDEVAEVLATCREIARHDRDAFGIYIISMASKPSDVLAVKLLLKICGVPFDLPVAPLFETLDDLQGAPDCIRALFDVDWYRDTSADHQHVMIGYSDSAKDAGVLAAAWGQYHAQELLGKVADELGITLSLFHGRGGTIGRGGGPAHSAILSQPPGSLDGGLRVTEQGEMIRFKFGLPAIAERSLALYASATLEGLLLPPPQPEPGWRDAMEQLSNSSCAAYRNVVRDNPDFVDYFRSATPEQELGQLPLGSRPAKRKSSGGIESLRAIPWIFSWSQNRLVLPSWLGAGDALKQLCDAGKQDLLQDMFARWPFFNTRLNMLEMVYMKSDSGISAYYDAHLVPEDQRAIGDNLRQQLSEDIHAVLKLTSNDSLMDKEPWNRESIQLRAPYMYPLHILQTELLRRTRDDEADPDSLQQALMVTITGIAAGMRNSG